MNHILCSPFFVEKTTSNCHDLMLNPTSMIMSMLLKELSNQFMIESHILLNIEASNAGGYYSNINCRLITGMSFFLADIKIYSI